MINNIPTFEEFESAAKSQFDFAWDIAISFLLTLENAEKYNELEEDDKKHYWKLARQRLLTSLIITQQGVELSIKGKIVAISPYLLISGSPSDWPKEKNEEGLEFSDFRTIDAQDLIKVHNTFAEINFERDFIDLFEKLRKQRNSAMHSVDRKLNVAAQDVIVTILELYSYLYPNEKFVKTRREFLNDSPDSHVYLDYDRVSAQIVTEFFKVFELITPSQVRKFFGFDKKSSRLYFCPKCIYEAKDYSDVEPKYAILNPNEPDSERLYCFVCDEEHIVERVECTFEECKGNAISMEYGVCCSCGKDQ